MGPGLLGTEVAAVSRRLPHWVAGIWQPLLALFRNPYLLQQTSAGAHIFNCNQTICDDLICVWHDPGRLWLSRHAGFRLSCHARLHRHRNFRLFKDPPCGHRCRVITDFLYYRRDR